LAAASASVENNSNWIPAPFQRAAENLAKDAVKRYLKSNQVVGLGSGPMAAAIVREMAEFSGKENLECVVTSYQIKLEARRSGLRVVDESRIPEIKVVFDGADEVDQNLDMIKGGGGALLREKILHTAASTIVIAAESTKFVQKFTWPVPIEVHPFAISLARKELVDAGGLPRQRMLKEGYPYVTENGNFILDTEFDSFSDPSGMETKVKDIPRRSRGRAVHQARRCLLQGRGRRLF
jgi:ribose 5-phosphate isomerase A